MQLSHSRVSCFVKCPYQFKLRYVDKLQTLPKNDPQDALVLGHALHTGIEKTTEDAIEEYKSNYPIITDAHINEIVKLEYWLPKIKEILPEGLHEIKIEDEDFIGFIDLLVPIEKELKYNYKDNYETGYEYVLDINSAMDNTEYYDLYDFKYSNNVKNYLDSEQLHLYKYYFEKQYPTKKIRNMYFMFVPKCNLRIKYKNKTNKTDETIYEFRKRVVEDLDGKQVEFVPIEYDKQKVIDFLTNGKHAIECKEYVKNPTRLCDWCEYQGYCERGEVLDLVLPKNERTSNASVTKRKIWIYGAPFSGKTYLANQFPDMLLLSTDGNYTQLPEGIPPHVDIKDIVTVEGRITKKQFAWDVFKETIGELEKKQNDFKTIVVDLIEDCYESCRLYMYDQLGITHESDDSFRAWDKVRTEFLSTIKRLMNLDYENIILISHEDTSKDVTKKSGDKITAIKPNLGDKPALKISGMVDMVVRLVNDEGKRTISFKTSDVVFGGGRLSTTATDIPCDYDELIKIYSEANEEKQDAKTSENKPNDKQEASVPVETAVVEPKDLETPEKKARTRKPREVVEEATVENTAETAENTTEEAAPRRRRKRVSE